MPKATIVWIFLFLFSLQSVAQFTIFYQNSNTISLGYLRPEFDDQLLFDPSFLTGAYFLSGKYIIHKKDEKSNALHIQIPVSIANLNSGFFNNGNENMLGNLLVAYEFNQGDPLSYEIGLRLPTAANDKIQGYFTGLYSDVNNFEAFLIDAIVIYGAVKWKKLIGYNVFFDSHADIIFMIDNGEVIRENELFIDYGVHVGYQSKIAQFAVGLESKNWLTTNEEILLFRDGDNAVYQAIILVNFKLGKYAPGLSYRVPFNNDINDFVDTILGFNITYLFDQ